MTSIRRWLPLVLVVLAVVMAVGWAARSPLGPPVSPPETSDLPDIDAVVAELDAWFDKSWRQAGIDGVRLKPAQAADELTVLRRLSLALCGTIPSLEELRAFEQDTRPDRLRHWTQRLLTDGRFADYFAERLARMLVGTDQGPFIIFRRDRFTQWLREALAENRPYDEIVRQAITGAGLWTGAPASNFITSAVVEGRVDANRLAAQSVRAFLGQSMDCAQCHDHPFDDWKQADFEGLAAHFGSTKVTVFGVADDPTMKFAVQDRETLEQREVEPRVPFHPEWLSDEGTHRERLAGWITHPQNVRFERAIVNRVWGLLCGRPLIAPVDDLPDPPAADDPDALAILGTDFRAHGCDLRRLIHIIAASGVYRLSSRHEVHDAETLERLQKAWAVFPLTRLRPEQVVGSMLQAASLRTIDQQSHLLVRTIRFFRERDFVKEYGDLGADELVEQSGTIPQALLRMNGDLPAELTQANFFSAAGRIAMMSGSDTQCLDNCFLVCLTRHPTAEESDYFLAQLKGTEGDARERLVEDIFWALFNSEEFSWNH